MIETSHHWYHWCYRCQLISMKYHIITTTVQNMSSVIVTEDDMTVQTAEDIPIWDDMTSSEITLLHAQVRAEQNISGTITSTTTTASSIDDIIPQHTDIILPDEITHLFIMSRSCYVHVILKIMILAYQHTGECCVFTSCQHACVSVVYTCTYVVVLCCFIHVCVMCSCV